MKIFTKVKTVSLIIAISAIALFAACSPDVEVTDYNWKAVNAAKDPLQKLGDSTGNYGPAATITSTEQTNNVYTKLEIDITFDGEADVLRGEITEASLNFITFHSFTYATTAFTADTLSTAIPFTVKNRAGDVVTVTLTTNIAMATAYSNIIMKVDAQKYTYAHGLRLDTDTNGKIEAVYDDFYYVNITLNGASITSYTAPGQQSVALSLGTITAPIYVATAPATPAAYNAFYFVGSATTSTSSTLRLAIVGYETSGTDAAVWNAFYKDYAGKLAAGIKLQKWNGSAWEDKGTAEYNGEDTTTPTIQGYIIIKNVSFDHLGNYRLVWTGSAYTETDGSYYGVKQRIYIGVLNTTPPANANDASRFTRTEVAGAVTTTYNNDVNTFYANPENNVTVSRYSYDHEGQNNVYRFVITQSGYFWNSVALDAFKKSFELYALTSNIAVDIATVNHEKVDIVKVEFKNELTGTPTYTGDNVLYVTVDPKYRANNKYLTARINNGISVTNKAAIPTNKIYYFGGATGGNGLYDFFTYLGPF